MSDSKTLRAALETEVKSLNTLIDDMRDPNKDAIKVDGSTVTINEEAYNAVKSSKAKIAQLKDLLSTDGEIKDARALLDAPADTKSRYSTQAEFKSIANMLFESDEFKEMMETGRPYMRQDVSLDIADVVSRKDVYSDMFSYTTRYNVATNVQQLPTIPAQQTRQRVRDLFPAASTTANLLEYWKQLGLTTNGASVVAERTADNTNFGLKPKSDIGFEHASDPIRTIAHWIPVHRNTLADRPQMRSLIDNQLLYGLAQVEDAELLNGDGTGEHILGLMKRPGIQSYTPAGATEWKSDSLRRAQTLAELTGFPSTGYVLHPTDWEDIELQRGSTNDHYAITTNIAVGAQQRVWRLPVVTTPMITEGEFLSAAFGQACQIYDREQANIRVAEQHADFFVRNAVVILCEERLGLAVQNPSAIVHGTFA